MRKLNVDDVFNASNLIDLFSLPAVYSKLKDADRSDPEGFARMAMIVLIKEAATESSRRKIYEFLSGPFEIPERSSGRCRSLNLQRARPDRRGW